MRVNFIDNLRWIFVCLLFPYHTFMVYNNFGESFYVKGVGVQSTTYFIMALWPWFMPLLFLIAGISSSYALKKRTPEEYINERVSKLLIPLIFGVLLLVPIQTYFAEVFHNAYSGGYFNQYILFFTKVTDLTGYNGGFSPAHLWFILYLFIISIISLPIMIRYQKSEKATSINNISLPILLLFFAIPLFSQIILDIGGKSVGEYLAYFLFGYFLISSIEIQEKLEKNRLRLLFLTMICIFIYAFAGETIEMSSAVAFEIFYHFYAWVSVLTIIGFGKRYLEFKNKISSYLSEASFSIYFLHQQWIVIVGYFILKWIQNVPLQMILIILGSALFTFLNYEIFRRFSITRFMFGIKSKNAKT